MALRTRYLQNLKTTVSLTGAGKWYIKAPFQGCLNYLVNEYEIHFFVIEIALKGGLFYVYIQ